MEIKYSINLSASFELTEKLERNEISHIKEFCKFHELVYDEFFHPEYDWAEKRTMYIYLSQIYVYFNNENFEKYHEKILELFSLIRKKEEEDIVPF